MSLYVGAISGTSVDGLDLALVSVAQQPTILHSDTVEFPAALRTRLLDLIQDPTHAIEAIGRAHVALGQFIGASINEFLSNHQIDKKSVCAIGSHGQTISHHPNGAEPFSLQIGDGSSITELTGLTTACDFRSRDIAAGGEGAPLVPLFHQALFAELTRKVVVLNIGGIANISILPADADSALRGYDTGPGNALLDAWIQLIQNLPCDLDGVWSRSGQPNRELLTQLLSHEYFALPDPKSTGKELFNLGYIQKHLTRFPALPAHDVQATLLEATCESIAQAIRQETAEQVIVCGGGRLNSHLMERLQALIPESEVIPSDTLGIDGDAIEAATFAYLAWALLESLPGNVPSVTNARGPRLLGCIYPATAV